MPFTKLTLAAVFAMALGQIGSAQSFTSGLSAPVTSSDVSATVQAQVQSVATVTDASGYWSASWPDAFSAAPTVASATVLAGSPPYICSVTIKTASSVGGRCYQIVANTLPVTTTALLGLVVSPIANPAAGLTVMVVGRL